MYKVCIKCLLKSVQATDGTNHKKTWACAENIIEKKALP